MSKLDDILEMLKRRESMFPIDDMEALIGWMGDRPDEEVVELMRTACTELAWRVTGGDKSVYPSNEVFYEATERIAKEFYEQTRNRNDQRGK